MSTMTRNQFAIRLARELGLPAGSATEAVTALINEDITAASSIASFNGDSIVTREMAAAFFARAFDIKGGGTSSFTDYKDDQWWSEHVSGVQAAGIFSGFADGSFGIGQAFNPNHFDLVMRNIEDGGYLDPELAPTPTPTPPREPTGPSPDPVLDIDPSVPTNLPGVPEEPPFDEDAFDWAARYLEEYFDLPDMQDWVIDLAREFGASLSAEEIDLRIRETQPFQDRYGAVLDGRRAAGLNPISPAEILEFEAQARALMRASGLPPGFYDDNSDFHEMLIADVSPVELQDRIADGFLRVSEAPLEVRQAFADMRGINGDEALAAFFIDPDRAMPAIEAAVTDAEILGSARTQGFDIEADVVERLRRQGVDQNLAFTGFARLASLNPVFDETLGETDDLRAEDEGIEAEFFQNAEAIDALEDRVQSRQAAFSGGGGAAATSEGVVGLGTSR